MTPAPEILNGRYEILGPLGSGGMGVVQLARRLSLGDTVAIKQLHSDLDSVVARRRFETEARAAAFIRHPNVVEVFDFGSLPDGRPYLVMEHLEGPTLAEVIASEGPLPVERAIELFLPICAAVEAGHRRGILHRDLKPANVIIARRDDGSEQVKVLDFGLASFDSTELSGGTDKSERNTAQGTVLGTVEYMAPELVSGGGASSSSDVWALGVMLYEMLVGALPIEAPTPMALMYRIATGSWTAPEQARPDLPTAIVEALHAAASRAPADRPSSPEYLARMAAPSHGRSRSGPAATPERVASEDAATIETPTASSLRQQSAYEEPRFDGFVERETARHRVVEVVEGASAGRGRIAMVRGGTGVGKTAFLDRVGATLAKNGSHILRSRFFAYEGSRPPALETFKSMLPKAITANLATPGFDEGARWSLLEGLTDAFAALGREPPLVLLFDDVQWASPFELEAIEHLHRSLAPQGVAFVLAARDDGEPSDFDGWASRLVARRQLSPTTLSPFDERAVRAYLRACFGSVSVRPQDLARLTEITGGNPLFVTEVVRELFARGQISRGEATWTVGQLADLALPDEASELVRSALASLDPGLRGVLEAAAVIGDGFRFETLEQASDVDEETLERLVEAGVERGLLSEAVSGDDDFRFVSPVVRATLYSGLSRRKRRKIHRRVVDALEALYASRTHVLAPALSYHYHAIGDAPRAFETGLIAAERAIREHDVRGARAALERSEASLLRMSCSDVGIDERVRLDLAFGNLSVRTGTRLEESSSRLERVCRSGSPAQRLTAASLLGRGALRQGEHTRALAALDQAISIAEDTDADHAGTRARLMRAIVLFRNGDISGSASEADAVLAQMQSAPPALQAAAERHRAWVSLKTGAFDEAAAHARSAHALARASGDLVAQQLCVGTLAAVYGEAGDEGRALPLQIRATELARRIGDRRREAIGLANTGEAYSSQGRSDEALAHFNEALSIFVEIGDRACEGDCRVNVGRGLLRSGFVVQAVDMLRRGQALCEETGRVEYAAIAALLLGEAAMRHGDGQAATQAYLRARGQLRSLDSHLLWKAELGLARAARLENDVDGAMRHAQSAASKVIAQKARIPAGSSRRSFESATTGVFELIEELKAS